MGKKWRQLKYEDRLKIYAWLQDKISVATIAKRLGVCRQTIYREIKRGEFVKRNTDYTESTVYDPYVAEEHYQKKLKERGRDLKIGSDLKLLHYIEKKIVDEKRSPAAALHEIKKEGKEFTVTLSTNTIYSYIKKGIFLNITMEDLPEKKKQHKKKKVKVQKRVQAGDSISQRPEHIDFREEFGHWEMDTVVGPQGKSKKVMLVLTERKTRKEIVYLMPDRKAQTVVKTLNMIERKCGERLFRDVFKTITVDNGVEFSDAEGLEKSRRNKKKRTKVYYCHPYSSCERGSNENANRLIRRHIPKGVNFDKKSKTEIKEIETWINNYPRKIFEYDKYPYGKPQTDEVARGSGNREYGCRRLREKLPNFSGVSFFRAGNSSNRVNAFHICVYVHLCVVPRYIASQHP